MSSYLRSVVTWDERQTHRGCVRRVSSSSRTYISIYMANIWWPWRRLSGGKGEGLGALRGIRCGFRRMIEASLWESLARSGPRAPAPTPQSVEVIQWGYSVTTMRKEREHGSTVTSPGGRGLFSRSSKDPLSRPYPTGKDFH